MESAKLAFLSPCHIVVIQGILIMNSEHEFLIRGRGQKVAVVDYNLVDEIFYRDHFGLSGLLLALGRLFLLSFLIRSNYHIVFIAGMCLLGWLCIPVVAWPLTPEPYWYLDDLYWV